MSRWIAILFALSISFAGLCAAAPVPADVVTVGSVSAAAGATVDVPVYIRDTSGTALGIDQPAGSRIQSYSIKVDFAPAADVQSVTFTRAGITAALTPTFESTPSSAGSRSLLDTFNEATNLVPFTSNSALPGNQIGVLHFTLASSAIAGDIINLTLDPALTQLSNQGGTTVETISNASLTLVNGQIAVNAALTVSVTGSGSVSAGATPVPQSGGISNCTSAGGSACSANYPAGAIVTLSATVPTGQYVTWGGACTATSPTTATVTMSAGANCTAAFAAIPVPMPAPMLSRWGLLLLGGMLGLIGYSLMRRAQAAGVGGVRD